MIRTCLALCVMVHITVCCGNTDPKCDFSWTTMKLTMNCTVSSNPNSTHARHKWFHNGTELVNYPHEKLVSTVTSFCIHNVTSNSYSCVSNLKCDDTYCNVTYNHTIPSASWTLCGTYRFWVQLNTGNTEKSFNISDFSDGTGSSVTESTTGTQSPRTESPAMIYGPGAKGLPGILSGTFLAGLAVLGLLVFAVWWRRNKK